MTTHKRNQAGPRIGPLCLDKFRKPTPEGTLMADEIDEIDCVNCLRMLAKDAVLYGRDRRPRRTW